MYYGDIRITKEIAQEDIFGKKLAQSVGALVKSLFEANVVSIIGLI